MENIVRDKYSMFTVIYSMVYVYKEGRLSMTFSSVKVVLYSFCFYIACKTAKKKRIIKFVWSELTIIRYRTIYMYAADCPPFTLREFLT